MTPSELCDVICVTPAIWPNWRSSGAATEVAMVSALAPGKRRGDLDGRKVDLRQRRHRQERKRHNADERQRRHHERGRDRPADEGFRDVHGAAPLALPACGEGGARQRAGWGA